MKAGALLFKLPETPDEISLSHDVIVDADDLQRFIAMGGLIYKRGYQIEVSDGGFIAFPTRQVINPTAAALRKTADHYRARAQRSTEAGVQLACLVLANYCTTRLEGSDGPTLEMIMTAEAVLGQSLNDAVAAQLKEITP